MTPTAIQKAISLIEKHSSREFFSDSMTGLEAHVAIDEALTLLKSLPDGGDVEALKRDVTNRLASENGVIEWTSVHKTVDYLNSTGRLNTAPQAATSEGRQAVLEDIRRHDQIILSRALKCADLPKTSFECPERPAITVPHFDGLLSSMQEILPFEPATAEDIIKSINEDNIVPVMRAARWVLDNMGDKKEGA